MARPSTASGRLGQADASTVWPLAKLSSNHSNALACLMAGSGQRVGVNIGAMSTGITPRCSSTVRCRDIAAESGRKDRWGGRLRRGCRAPSRSRRRNWVIAGEPDQTEDILHDRLLHRINQRRELARVLSVVFRGDDKRAVGGKAPVKLHNAWLHPVGDVSRGVDDVVLSIGDMNPCTLEERVVIRRENV